MNLYEKLIEVRKCVPYLQKEKQSQQYKYVSSSQVLANCIAKMNELGVLLVPQVIDHRVTASAIEQEDKATGTVTKRTHTYFTELDMEYTWINAEKPEERIVCSWYGQGIDTAGEKGVGKALTYAEKYFMLKFYNIATDQDDPDAFQTKHEEKVAPLKPVAKPAPAKEMPSEEYLQEVLAAIKKSPATPAESKLVTLELLKDKGCIGEGGQVEWRKVSKLDLERLYSAFTSDIWQKVYEKIK